MDYQSDAELISAFLNGKVEAFAKIDDRYRKRLERFMIRRGLNHLLSEEDIAQETLNRAWQNLTLLKDENALAPWLFRIAVRLAIDLSRHKTISMTFLSEYDNIDSDKDSAPFLYNYWDKSPEELAIQTEERQNFWNTARSVLSEEEFQTIWMFYVEEYSTAEMALYFQQKIGAIRVRLHRARKKLAEKLTNLKNKDNED